MSIHKASRELRAKQTALDKLTGEKSKLVQSIEDLNKQRSAAARDFAGGDESKQETIFNLESEIGPLGVRLEGLETLIREAEEQVQTASAAVESANADRNNKRSEFIRNGQRADIERIRASLPERKAALVEAYVSFIEALGELNVDAIQYNLEEISKITGPGIAGSLDNALKTRGLRPLMVPGIGAQIAIWAHVHYPGSGSGRINAQDVAKAKAARRVEELEKEFEASYKG